MTLQALVHVSTLFVTVGQQPTISAGEILGDGFWVERGEDSQIEFRIAVSIDSENYPALPSGHSGYAFTNSADQPLDVLTGIGAPVQQSSDDTLPGQQHYCRTSQTRSTQKHGFHISSINRVMYLSRYMIFVGMLYVI